MIHESNLNDGIPIAPGLTSPETQTESVSLFNSQKVRLLYISVLAILIAMTVSVVAVVLIHLINFFTNLAFYGRISDKAVGPADNHLGLFVILIPVLGGLIVGLMAFYGSKAIRGHGIPEAMEQILTNQSRIRPAITWLKPLSSAISIGTGGPFGAEGPIIATGGALGSTIGQLLHISHYERKILLTAGATAGMSAIFGTPVAAIFLAIELLLFEFSPRSIIPVALACITGAAGHHFLFGGGAFFVMKPEGIPGNTAVGIYSLMGLVIGFIAAGITEGVYWIEDTFEKLPIHWMWWPAIGGLVVGIIGYFAPRTLGVGYENIGSLLSAQFPLKVVLFLCLLKLLSWAIALGSGTSGGTLAPLLTIGAATGTLLGILVLHFLPFSGITIPIAALIGMSAMFAGASRALLTSIVFALETTGQSDTLLPLLGACMGSYIVSYFLMENTIMTEKIARRGIKTPESYEPDALEGALVEDVLDSESITISEENTIGELKAWLQNNAAETASYFAVVDATGAYKGTVNLRDIYASTEPGQAVSSLASKKHHSVEGNQTLKEAVVLMSRHNLEVLPVVDRDLGGRVIGLLSFKNIMQIYKQQLSEHEKGRSISIKRRTIAMLLHGQRLITKLKLNKR